MPPTPALTASDAVAAIIRLDDGRFLMQLRDSRPDIWYPGTWGCFGGAVNHGEAPLEALRRELGEEIEFAPREARFFTRFDFDFRTIGMRPCYRIYFLVPMSEAEFQRLVLHEGEALGVFSYQELADGMRVTPYDAFALHLLNLAELSGQVLKEIDA
ncbi:MAG: NUDIX domain-containing protein [Betaproteobacteria bacterium]|nr:NUDIX domain-containing protein [Betaproteobacteria bacterium]MBI2961286.1 NUDIX domain-containing protein [Betaproteobacteria bacterium]